MALSSSTDLQAILDTAQSSVRPEALLDALQTWDALQTKLAHYKRWEMEFRKTLFNKVFPAPTKGVNKFPLAAGYVLKGTPGLNFKLDQQLFPKVRAELASQNASLDDYLKVSYSLNESNYFKLQPAIDPDTGEIRTNPVASVLNQMITTTPGAPKMEIVLPANAKV